MSSFPGHGVRRVFLFGRIAYSIPRIEELPRVALSMNWMLQIEHNRNAIVETRLEGGTNTVLEISVQVPRAKIGSSTYCT
jgi:hypothetical protein